MAVQSNQREPAKRVQKVWYNTLRGQCVLSHIHMNPSPQLSLISTAEHTGNTGKAQDTATKWETPTNQGTLHSMHALKLEELSDLRTMKGLAHKNP